MPPTNATRSSITIVFSWWQCSGRSCASRAHWIFVCRVSRSRICRTSPREGRKSGSGAPAQASTRTSMRSASSASRLRRTSGSPSRVEREVGREIPAGQMDVRASLARSSSAIARQRLRAVDEHLERVALPHQERFRPSRPRPDRARVPSRSAAAAARDVCASAPTADRQTTYRRESSRDAAATTRSTTDGSGDECPVRVAIRNPCGDRRDQPPALPRRRPPPHVVHGQRGPDRTETAQKEQTQETHRSTVPPNSAT